MTGLASAAPRLAQRGRAVFPLAEGAKKPMKATNGFHAASTDPVLARDRWREHPRANIGVATGSISGIWAFDVDRQHDGHKTLQGLCAKHDPLPTTVGVHTPSGGFHLWFKWPPGGIVIRNSAGRIGPGLDVRGDGGYVVAPPSRLSNGRSYTWFKDPVEILPAPTWLIKLALPPEPVKLREVKPLEGDVDNYVATAVADELRQLSRARDGTRNDTLNKTAFAIAGFVKGGYLPHDWAIAKLETVAVKIGLPQSEARATIRSAFIAASPREMSS